MAKSKEEPKLINCSECYSVVHYNNETYCKLKMIDENKYTDYAKVKVVIDCNFFRFLIKV